MDTVVDRIAGRAARQPDADAVVCGRRRLSYAELNASANRLAATLNARGAGLESRVAVCVGREVDLAVALLGVVKSGAAYVALDPAYPVERLQLMVKDADVAFVVAGEDVTAELGAPRLTVAETRDAPDREPAVAPAPHNAMYVVYTSGSTGRPKAVIMDHGPTARLMRWAEQRYHLSGPVLQYFPATSDVCGYEFFSAWWSGGCAVMADETERLDAAALADLIDRERVGTALLPPAMLDRLTTHHAERLGGVAEFVTTGDRLTIGDPLRRLCATGGTVDNQWGSTEVNVVTALRLEPPAESWPDLPSIGSPVSGGRIYVLDRNLRQTPIDVAGDLYVGGGQLARGYLGRPDLTATAFLPDPFASTPGGRMYRTGDKGRWRPDGTLQFLGRADFQVKVHGYRVEPGEIEAVLRGHPSVARAAVSAHPTADGRDNRLAAFVVPEQGAGAPDVTELREWLRQRLPDHMVPHSYGLLERMPTTPTGKVDRARLPDPVFEPSAPTAPANETERVVLGIWQDALGRPDLGVEDNFFESGGYSLLIPQVVRRTGDALGTRLPLRTLFRFQTVRTLAGEVERLRSAS